MKSKVFERAIEGITIKSYVDINIPTIEEYVRKVIFCIKQG